MSDPLFRIRYNDKSVIKLLQLSSDQIRRLVRGEVRIGTSVPYMRYHQLGEGGQKKRQFLGLSAENKRVIRNELKEGLPPNRTTARAVYKSIGEYMILEIDEGFERQADPFGRPWEAINPRTLERKRRLGRIEKILQDTGTGRNSINYRVK